MIIYAYSISQHRNTVVKFKTFSSKQKGFRRPFSQLILSLFIVSPLITLSATPQFLARQNDSQR